MSDASSTVTYMSVYTNSEPWRYYGEESMEAGSPGVIVYGYDGLPMQPVASPSPDYVPGLEHPPSPDYVPDPEHPPSRVEIPYDLEEDPEDDHVDYPANGRDGDDEPSDDDNDDDDTDDEDEEPFEDEEEEEHLAPTDFSTVPIVDHVLPDGDKKALEDDEPAPTPRSPHTIIPLSQIRLRRARKTVILELPMSASMEACIARHAALLSPPLPVPSPPLPLTDIPEADVPPQKKACLTTFVPEFKVGESFAAGAARQPRPTESDLMRCRVEQTGYGITDTWDEIVDTLMEIASTTLEGVNQRVTKIDTIVWQRTDEFEIQFEEAQDDRALLRARVNTLFRDRPDHHRIAMLLDREAMYARETWAGFEDRSAAIVAHVRALEAHVYALIAQTSSLQTIDYITWTYRDTRG
uniref:Uncharacterized protein n=1 Tax=Tanacetum cinerariifolium TaxID=118510 RepID=A0A699KAH0_TANCI|nr:hypothetical protein [Tanacetum cinerariifolium]